ncbi:hypothetical protein JXK06_03125 [Patescibacteria group bacterium]|nr:hypothetical protein [Patescibacteria group bacterium]
MPTNDKTSVKTVNSKNIFIRIKVFINNKANLRKFFKIKLVIILILLAIFYVLKVANYYPREINLEVKPGHFGVTFSTKYSTELDLDYKEVYSAMLSELKVKNIRIPIYWDEIEKEKGVFDFSVYDYLIEEGEKYDAKFIISLGRRVPRWPECHSPAWLGKLEGDEVELATLTLTRKIVERYKDRTSVEYWQVENEPFLGTFGVCPPLNEKLLKQQFDLVRLLDDREIIITSSGELKFWNKEAEIGDIFGSTLYRVVHNHWFGFVRYPMPPAFYRLKGKLAGLSPERLMVLELQAEPWVPEGKIIYLTEKQINKTMSVKQFKANLQYAINLDFRRTYAWGVEWWYWQKLYGNPEYWWIASTIFK